MYYSGLGLRTNLSLSSPAIVVGGESFDPATVAYLAAMATQPTATQAIQINKRIVAIKARAGLWDKLVMLNFYDIHDAAAALINVKNPAFNSTAENGVTFTQYSGYTGKSGAYINTGIKPSTSDILTLDSLHLGAWVSNVQYGSAWFMGAVNVAATSYVGIRRSSEVAVTPSAALNNSLIDMKVPSGTLGFEGHFVATRVDGGTARKFYQNGVFKSGFPNADKTDEVDRNIYVCNLAGGNSPNLGIIKIAHIGINIGDDDVAAIYAAINDNPIMA